MNESQKYRQIRREAAFTGLALAVLIVFWLIAGFGTAASGVNVKVMHLPLWALLGSIGVWIVAIALTFGLTHFIFKDMELDETKTPRDTADSIGQTDDSIISTNFTQRGGTVND